MEQITNDLLASVNDYGDILLFNQDSTESVKVSVEDLEQLINFLDDQFGRSVELQDFNDLDFFELD